MESEVETMMDKNKEFNASRQQQQQQQQQLHAPVKARDEHEENTTPLGSSGPQKGSSHSYSPKTPAFNTTMTGSTAFLCPPSPRRALKKTKESIQEERTQHSSSDLFPSPTPTKQSSTKQSSSTQQSPALRNTRAAPSTQEGEKHDIMSFDGLSPTGGTISSSVEDSSEGPPSSSSPSYVSLAHSMTYKERSQSWPPRDSMWKELEQVTPTRPWEGEFIRYRIVEFMGSPVPVPGLSPYKVALVSRVLNEEKKKKKNSSYISPLRFVLKNRQGGYDVVEQSSLKQVHVLAHAQKQRKKKHGSMSIQNITAGGGGGVTTMESLFMCTSGGGAP